MPAATGTRKRKQTDDMEVSPPKRVTRARSAKTQDAPAPTATKPARATKANTGSKDDEKSKSTARITKAAATTSKRATRSKDTEQVSPDPEHSESDNPEAELPKARGRPKKAATMPPAEQKNAEAPKTRGRATKSTTTKAAAPKAAPVSSARTRKRAATIEEESEDELVGTEDDASQLAKPEEPAAPAPRKTTRRKASAATTTKGATNIKVTAPSRRAATTTSTTSRATGATAATTARSTAANKRVAFTEDNHDKENVPVRGKASTKPKAEEKLATTGMRGKPTRRAAAATTTTAAKTRGASTKKAPRPSTPLSPKKVIQVAKGSSSSSEDELGTKSPARTIIRSPIKPPQSVRKELPFASDMPPSPTKQDAQPSADPLLGKSPMKPPPSARKVLPFAAAAVSSPSKPNMQSHGEALGRQAALSSSILMSPAKKPPVSPFKVAISAVSPSKPLAQLIATPAKRVHLDIPNLSHEQPEAESKLKQSLLQSPPRRLKITSGSMTAIPREKKAHFAFGDADTGSEEIQAFNFSAATPRRLFPRVQTHTKVESISPDAEKDDILCDEQEDAGETPGESSEATDVRQHTREESNEEHEPAETDIISELDFDDTVVISPIKQSDEADIEESEEASGEERDAVSTTPSGFPSAFALETSRTLFRAEKADDSDDELSATSSFRASDTSIATANPSLKPRTARQSSVGGHQTSQPGTSTLAMTPLAHQFNNWLTANETEPTRSNSLAKSPERGTLSSTSVAQTSPAKVNFFEDEMLARESATQESNEQHQTDIHEDVEDHSVTPTIEIHEDDEEMQDDEDSENVLALFESHSEYGDENTVPIDPQLMNTAAPVDVDFAMPMDVDMATETADPLELNMTPVQAIRPVPREVMTVSKVPLKSADESSPIKTFRKKAKSLAPALGEVNTAPLASLEPSSFGRQSEAPSQRKDKSLNELSFSPGPQPSEAATPTRLAGGRVSSFGSPTVDDTLMNMTTPFKTPRVGADAQILCGAVVFVDVHTVEGGEASDIFVQLLTQMGARCVKQWTWNPRASGAGPKGETPGGTKVGITHVVYKDGGKRTLEKVREARGLVSCVGVGWVLDCERENKWLDEADYTVDTSLVPRGGHNRRKSMEPKALANVNGTLRPVSGTPNRSFSTPAFNMSPTKEFLTFSNVGSPTEGDVPTFGAATPTLNFGATNVALPETPAILKSQDWALDGNIDMSKTPATPYLMSKGAELIQATCPPKQQTGRMLFPVSGRIEDEKDEEVKRRLFLARRKSLQWAPKIGSPLRRE